MAADSLDDALGTVAGYARSLNHEIVQEYSTYDSRNNLLEGYLFEHSNGSRYNVHGIDRDEYLTVEYKFNLVGHLAEQFTDEQVERWATAPLAEKLADDEDPAVTAARAKIDVEYNEQLNEHTDELRDLVFSPQATHTVVETPNGTLVGFSVSARIFPYENGFTLREYNRATRTVAQLGLRAQHHLMAETDVLDDAQDPEDLEPLEEEDEEDGLRAFA